MTSYRTISAASLDTRHPNDFRRRYEKFFFITTVVATALPGLAPLKLVTILALWCYMLLGDSFTIAAALWAISVMLNLLLGFHVGAVFQEVPMNLALSHFVRLLLFFVSLSIGGYTAVRCSISQKRLDQLIFVIAAGLMSFKFVLMVAVLTGWVSFDGIQKIFGFDSVTEGIGLGLQRLQFPSDIIAPFLMACYVGGEKKIKDGFLLLCIAGVIFLSFSRFLFAFYLLCVFLRAFLVKRIDFITVLNMIISVGCVIVFFHSILVRFASADTDASDQTRVDQIRYLKIGIRNFPLLGTGLGSYAHDFLRGEDTPYLYEAQWYATTMQMGFVGVVWYVVNILLVLYSSLRRNYLLFTLVFSAWFFSGFTNPYLTGLGSAFGLSILLLRCNGENAREASSAAAA